MLTRILRRISWDLPVASTVACAPETSSTVPEEFFAVMVTLLLLYMDKRRKYMIVVLNPSIVRLHSPSAVQVEALIRPPLVSPVAAEAASVLAPLRGYRNAVKVLSMNCC